MPLLSAQSDVAGSTCRESGYGAARRSEMSNKYTCLQCVRLSVYRCCTAIRRCIEVDMRGDDEGGKMRHRRVLDARKSDKPPCQAPLLVRSVRVWLTFSRGARTIRIIAALPLRLELSVTTRSAPCENELARPSAPPQLSLHTSFRLEVT